MTKTDENLSLEHRFFNIVMFLVCMAGTISLVQNIICQNNFLQTTTSFIAAFGGLSVYLLSINKHIKFELLTYPSIGLFFIILLLLWISSSGVNGGTGYFYFLYLISGIIIVNKEHRIPFIFFVFITLVILFVIEYFSPDIWVPYADEKQKFFDIISCILIALTIGGSIMHMVFKHYLLEREEKDKLLAQTLLDKEEIQKAMEEIKILRGYIPICAKCKKIRDDKGFWNQIEMYIEEHSEALFTHGLCPECAKNYFPNYHKSNEV